MSFDHKAFAERHPHPADDPFARLGHVLEIFADQRDDEFAITATHNAYNPFERTGLTWGDLRTIANSQFPASPEDAGGAA